MHKNGQPVTAGHQPRDHITGQAPRNGQLAAPARVWAHRLAVHVPHGNIEMLVGGLAQRCRLGKRGFIEIDVCMKAVANDGNALEYCSGRLRNLLEVVKIAVKQDKDAWRYAGADIRLKYDSLEEMLKATS